MKFNELYESLMFEGVEDTLKKIVDDVKNIKNVKYVTGFNIKEIKKLHEGEYDANEDGLEIGFKYSNYGETLSFYINIYQSSDNRYSYSAGVPTEDDFTESIPFMDNESKFMGDWFTFWGKKKLDLGTHTLANGGSSFLKVDTIPDAYSGISSKIKKYIKNMDIYLKSWVEYKKENYKKNK